MKKPTDAFPRIRRIEDCAVNIICFILLLAVIFFTICLLIVICQAAICDHWCIHVNSEGIKNMQAFWLQHVALLKAFFSSLTLFVASHTLIKYIDVETCRSLGEIRGKLNDECKKKIHENTLDSEDKEELNKILEEIFEDNEEKQCSPVDVLDYLGTLEFGAIMLQRGILSEAEFDNQFGYRVDNLIGSKLMTHIINNPVHYQPLLYAISVISKRRAQR